MKYVDENAIKKLISLIKGDLAKKQDSITVSGLLKGDGAGTVTAADTQEATLVDVPNGLLKGDGTTISAAVAEIDYMAPPTGGTTGQVLKKTENGTEWGDAPQTVTIPETTALLKGDGAGGVAAVTTDATPTQGSTNPVQSGGVYTALADKLDKTGDGSNVTAAFTAASSRTNIATGEKLSVLFGKIAKWLSDLGSLAFKSTVAKSDLASNVQTSLDLADTALQSLPSHNHDASAIDSGILPVIRGGTGVTSLDALATALGAARIQTGSYTGTGTYGKTNPCRLTFSFVPKLVIICTQDNYFATSTYMLVWNGQFFTNDYYTSQMASISGKTFSWWDGHSAEQQLNKNGFKYSYTALG